MPMPKNRVRLRCEICQSEFEVVKSREGKARFCSKDCRYQWSAAQQRIPRVLLHCELCGKEFLEHQCHADRRRFCSHRCRSQSAAARQECAVRVSGDRNPMWQGGRTTHSGGYVYIRSQGHPFTSHGGGYVFEHRLVIEQWMREEAPDHPWLVTVDGEKYLSPDIHVHHINHKRDDNARHNLIALTPGNHTTLHQTGRLSPSECWPEENYILV